MSLSGFFKKAGISAIALTTLGAVVKHQLERHFEGPDPDKEVISTFEKAAQKMRTDPRGGFNFTIGETAFHIDQNKRADYEKILQYIPVTGSEAKFGRWQVSQDVLKANTEVAFKFGIPLSLMMKIQGVESGFDKNNINKDTQACGLGQFVPKTLYQKTYDYAEAIGYKDMKSMVVRFDPNAGNDKITKAPGYKPVFDYRPADENAGAMLAILCTDARYNAHLKGQYLASNIARLQTQLADSSGKAYPLTSVQAYGAHFAGENRILRMIRDLGNEKKAAAPASTYFSTKEVKQNAPYFFSQNHQPRSLENFFDNLATTKGLGNEVLPDMRGWKIPAGEITIKNADILISGLEKLNMNAQPVAVEAKFTPVMNAKVPLPTPRPNNIRPG